MVLKKVEKKIPVRDALREEYQKLQDLAEHFGKEVERKDIYMSQEFRLALEDEPKLEIQIYVDYIGRRDEGNFSDDFQLIYDPVRFSVHRSSIFNRGSRRYKSVDEARVALEEELFEHFKQVSAKQTKKIPTRQGRKQARKVLEGMVDYRHELENTSRPKTNFRITG